MVTGLLTSAVSSLHPLYTIIVHNKKQAKNKSQSLIFLTALQPSFYRKGNEGSPSLQDPVHRVLSLDVPSWPAAPTGNICNLPRAFSLL